MSKSKKKSTTSGFKRVLLEWGIIAAVVGALYISGLHTEVLGAMQRAMLWTGLFDAEVEEVTTVEGPTLSPNAYKTIFTTQQGEELPLWEFRDKVIFVNIWASWCPPCVAEMPTIESLYKQVADNQDIRFLLVSLDEESQKAVDFMEGKGYSMPYYFPSSGLPQVFRSSYIPSTYVISKEGKVIYKKEGIADYSSRAFREWLLQQAQ